MSNDFIFMLYKVTNARCNKYYYNLALLLVLYNTIV